MIFCVEDDTGIRELMLYTLNSTGFEARGFECGDDFWAAMNETLPEMVLLDIMLPGEDGLTILKRLKAQKTTTNIPVIMATAKMTEYDKVIGLDLGADDYLVKPFGMMEMVSRVKAVLRRISPKPDVKELRVGELYLNEAAHTVFVAGEKVVLTRKEYEMLRFFMENLNKAFTRDQLLGEVWGYDFDGETRTVDVHIRTLRQKLGRCGEYIETVRGVGYRMDDKL
jgi:two-component system alkaline phosphatase synthesis response regulator PhoP